MSMIAGAHKLDSLSVEDATKFLEQNDTKAFWRLMGDHEMMTFPYSGYVLAAVIPFLGTRGVNLPKPNPEVFVQANGILLAGTANDYKSASLALSQLEATDDELRKYYRELYEHDWEEAAGAMREGFAFLQRAIGAINSEDELVVISCV
jgi:hypothetical protein